MGLKECKPILNTMFIMLNPSHRFGIYLKNKKGGGDLESKRRPSQKCAEKWPKPVLSQFKWKYDKTQTRKGRLKAPKTWQQYDYERGDLEHQKRIWAKSG